MLRLTSQMAFISYIREVRAAIVLLATFMTIPVSGEERIQKILLPGGLITISMAECPPGEMIDGIIDDEVGRENIVPTDGFEISQKEISIGDFAAVMGNEYTASILAFNEGTTHNPDDLLEDRVIDPLVFHIANQINSKEFQRLEPKKLQRIAEIIFDRYQVDFEEAFATENQQSFRECNKHKWNVAAEKKVDDERPRKIKAEFRKRIEQRADNYDEKTKNKIRKEIKASYPFKSKDEKVIENSLRMKLEQEAATILRQKGITRKTIRQEHENKHPDENAEQDDAERISRRVNEEWRKRRNDEILTLSEKIKKSNRAKTIRELRLGDDYKISFMLREKLLEEIKSKFGKQIESDVKIDLADQRNEDVKKKIEDLHQQDLRTAINKYLTKKGLMVKAQLDAESEYFTGKFLLLEFNDRNCFIAMRERSLNTIEETPNKEIEKLVDSSKKMLGNSNFETFKIRYPDLIELVDAKLVNDTVNRLKKKLSKANAVLVDQNGKIFANYISEQIYSEFLSHKPITQFPMYGITPREAEMFCEKLNQSQRGVKRNELGVSSSKYRLPTNLEWQYAARARPSSIEAKDYLHFVPWRKLPNKKDLKYLIKNGVLLENHPIQDDRNQIIDAILALDKKPDIYWNLDQYRDAQMNKNRGLERDKIQPPKEIIEQYESFQKVFYLVKSNAIYENNYSKRVDIDKKLFSVRHDVPNHKAPPRDLLPDYDSKPNKWGIFHMMDNLCEITTANNFDTHLLSGGSPFINPNTKVAYRNRFFIWGGIKISDLDAEILEDNRYSEEHAQMHRYRNERAGLRIVRTEGLSDRWFEAVRHDAYGEGSPDEKAKKIDGKMETIKRVARGEPLADKIESIASVYKDITRAQEGGGSKLTAEDIKPLAAEDRYFEYLSRVIEH